VRHPHQRVQAPGVAEAHPGQADDDRPAEVVDNLADVPERGVGGGHVKLAAELHGGAAGVQDPVAQLEWRLRILFLIHVHLPLDYGNSRSARETYPMRNFVH
jgi:hypothetical protein